MDSKTEKTKALSIRLSVETRANLEKAAAADHRSLSNMIELILVKYFEKNPV